jgi:hypothetical protein
MRWNEEFGYRAAAQLQVPKLTAVSAALSQMGAGTLLSGSFASTWKGHGKIGSPEHTGEWSTSGKDMEWKSVKLHALECSGRYEPGVVEASNLRVAAGDTVLVTPMRWSESQIRLEHIRIEQSGKEVLSGNLDVPVQWDGTHLTWEGDKPLRGALRAHQFNLTTIWKKNKTPPPITGVADLEVLLEGTPQSPKMTFSAGLTGLQSQMFPEFPKSHLQFSAVHQENVLETGIVLNSSFGGPARIQGKVHIPWKHLFETHTWTDAPFEARLECPKIRLEPLPMFVPVLKQVKGEASARGLIRGTWSKPNWSGELKMDCPTVHFRNDRIPAINELHLALLGEEGRLRLQSLRADLGGGTLEAHGDARGAHLQNPELDIHVQAKQVLVQRSQQLSLRLDGNLHVSGPLQSARVSGRVTPVKSLLRRDIEVLPLAALTTVSSGYRRPPGKPWFTFPYAPLANWTFDVGILSRPEDPILIRGNRIRGNALSDVRFQGLGKSPTLSGSYQTDRLVAVLPFARLEVTRGKIWYQAADPFAAQVDFNAETEVRNHRIRIALFGPPDSPAITISSDPPLPEQDALTLLTTGALPGAVGTESAQSMATRAASLLIQEFSDKFLGSPSGNRESFTALRRFNLELGAINNRTGTQETRLTYRILDNLFVIGEVGAGGDFASRLRYILRFR